MYLPYLTVDLIIWLEYTYNLFVVLQLNLCKFKLCHWLKWNEMKWNESGFRPPLCTYRLNWPRKTSWGWWDDWDDTVLQIQDSKFDPWRSEAEHATSRSRGLPTILTFTRGWGRNIFVSFKPPRPGTEPRTLAWKAAVLTTPSGPPPVPGANPGENWHASVDILDVDFPSFCYSTVLFLSRWRLTCINTSWTILMRNSTWLCQVKWIEKRAIYVPSPEHTLVVSKRPAQRIWEHTPLK